MQAKNATLLSRAALMEGCRPTLVVVIMAAPRKCSDEGLSVYR